MIRRKFRQFRKTETWRLSMLATGAVLLLMTIPIGALPGPGGIIVFGIGLALILRNSAWARRRYVWAKKRWPRAGHYSDLSLRRRSARRRHARRRERKAQSAYETGD
jgi:hypothetical protein